MSKSEAAQKMSSLETRHIELQQTLHQAQKEMKQVKARRAQLMAVLSAEDPSPSGHGQVEAEAKQVGGGRAAQGPAGSEIEASTPAPITAAAAIFGSTSTRASTPGAKRPLSPAPAGKEQKAGSLPGGLPNGVLVGKFPTPPLSGFAPEGVSPAAAPQQPLATPQQGEITEEQEKALLEKQLQLLASVRVVV
jgi:hypothetical protein